MADKDLVGYLRKHLPKYGPDALRSKLMEEGVPEADIRAAISEAVNPPKRNNKFPIYGAFVVAMIGAGMYLSRDSSNPSSPPPAVNTGKPPPDRTYLGHYGYVIKTPEAYNVVTDYKDFQKREVVYMFPKGVDTSNLNDEGLYAPMGIMRLEVSPRRIPEGRIGMDSVKTGVTEMLQKRKAVFTAQETQFAGLPTYIVTISQPFPLVQAFVIGTKVLYVLTGGNQDANFSDTLASLHETAAKDDLNAPAE